jgi:hypothetical protein
VKLGFELRVSHLESRLLLEPHLLSSGVILKGSKYLFVSDQHLKILVHIDKVGVRGIMLGRMIRMM